MKYIIRDVENDEIINIIEMSDEEVEEYELFNPRHYVLSEEDDINNLDEDEVVDISDLW